jgi:hypothetical protein
MDVGLSANGQKNTYNRGKDKKEIKNEAWNVRNDKGGKRKWKAQY